MNEKRLLYQDILRRRRSEDGKRLRREAKRMGGDYTPFQAKQMEIDSSLPFSTTITTFLTQDNLIIEFYA